MKRRMWSFLAGLGSMAFISGCFSASGADTGAIGPKAENSARCQSPEDGGQFEEDVLGLVNSERSKAGLPPVAVSPALSGIAGDYACRMIEDGFFGHRDPRTGYGPGERAVRGRYWFFAIGENLAAGQPTPVDVMQVWMESPSHKAIILDERWREFGVAVRVGGEYGIYWVQEFADPANY